MVATVPPSGEQVEIRWGRQRAIVVEVGGGLREYWVDGQSVLDGYAEDEMISGGPGQPLLPWPNRLQDGRYEFGGQTLQLPVNEIGHNNAIHGLTRWTNWTVAAREADRVTMALVLHPQPGYPFTLSLTIEYTLTDAGLGVRTRACNLGSAPLPYGAGQHPYLKASTDLVDDVQLKIPARQRVETDERQLPTGRLLAVAGSDWDFRDFRPIGAQCLDTCYTDLERDSDGLARVELRAGGGPTLSLWVDGEYPFVMAFTGDTLAPERRRKGLAVEPMTCPANAFRTGWGLKTLAPGQASVSTWGITFRSDGVS